MKKNTVPSLVLAVFVVITTIALPNTNVSANGDCTDECPPPTPIIIEDAPNCGFTADNMVGVAPFTVNFTNNGDSGNGITQGWNFGDNTPGSTEESPTHTYTGPGTFEVNQWVHNSMLSFCRASVTINVFPGNESTAAPVSTPAAPVTPETGNNCPVTISGEVNDSNVVVVCGNDNETEIAAQQPTQPVSQVPYVQTVQKVPWYLAWLHAAFVAIQSFINTLDQTLWPWVPR